MKNFRLKILDTAEQDIKNIEEYLAEHSTDAVRKFFGTMKK